MSTEHEMFQNDDTSTNDHTEKNKCISISLIRLITQECKIEDM